MSKNNQCVHCKLINTKIIMANIYYTLQIIIIIGGLVNFYDTETIQILVDLQPLIIYFFRRILKEKR